jgi:hypothetical protein
MGITTCCTNVKTRKHKKNCKPSKRPQKSVKLKSKNWIRAYRVHADRDKPPKIIC